MYMLFISHFFTLSTYIPNMFIRFGISSMTKGIFSVVAFLYTHITFFSAMQQRWKTHCGHLEVLERSLKYTPEERITKKKTSNTTKGEKGRRIYDAACGNQWPSVFMFFAGIDILFCSRLFSMQHCWMLGQ